jgi:hypothetical protein
MDKIFVKKHPNYWVPRDAIEFFRVNSDIWNRINCGMTVEISEQQYSIIKKYVEVVEQTEFKEVKISPSFKIKKINQNVGE